MKQRLAIIITGAVVLIVLVALNAASYVRLEKSSDLEWEPDRSTYNAGATGTRALYDFLHESGREVIRWTEEPASLLNQQRMQSATFVVVGKTTVSFKKEEVENLLRWVEHGGHLVLIDRSPDYRLLPPRGHWGLTAHASQSPSREVLADNPEQMTEGVQPMRTGQPTLLMRGVESVMPSRFAAYISIYAIQTPPEDGGAGMGSAEVSDSNDEMSEEDYSAPPPPAARRAPSPQPYATPPPAAHTTPPAQVKAPALPAPVADLYDSRGALLVDYKYGEGRVILLGDPFVVANNGISRADNLQLALNVIAGREGVILFDEFHQGRAAARNRLVAYFAGTPVLAMCAQLALIVLAVIWTRGKRFARPLPLPRVDRRSKLEYVASMAELQQRSRAYDLAIENVYMRTRRVLARYAGVDSMTARAEIAARVAARSKLDRDKLELLMRECEEAINGAPINARQSLELVSRLREVERILGLRLRSREIRQAKER